MNEFASDYSNYISLLQLKIETLFASIENRDMLQTIYLSIQNKKSKTH